MVQAWNTFLAEDYCSVAPDRLIAVGVMPVTGIDDAVAELKRCRQIGLKAVTFHQFPHGGGFARPEDDRFWSAALETNMALCPHVNFGERNPDWGGGARGTSGATVAAAMAMRCGSVAPTYALCQLIYNGVFDRFPTLQMYFAETNAGWMPSMFFFLDDNYAMLKDWYTEYIRKHCYFGIINDPVALRLRDHLPAERLMWGSDHPHSVCTFGHSREALANIFQGVPDSLKRRILLENPARFFSLDLQKPITETPQRAKAAAARS
jgi:predicted TIM-barrel fold metal-dependent hydrolase